MHYKDLKYGSHERHSVDIFIPDKNVNEFGVLLFIHGGGWSDGDKSAHFEDAEYSSDNGYISATINYRFVTDEINVFDELKDIALALAYIKSFCNNKGFYPEKVILCGGSAGAHLAMLYAYHYNNDNTLLPVAVCAYCPPVSCFKTDFLLGISGQFEEWKYEILSRCCSDKITKENFIQKDKQISLKRISPIEYITAESVPTAVFHGKYDDLVPIAHIYEFTEKLKALDIYCELLVFPESDHSLKANPECTSEARKIIVSFAEKYFKIN